jgi:hypothetical protein
MIRFADLCAAALRYAQLLCATFVSPLPWVETHG